MPDILAECIRPGGSEEARTYPGENVTPTAPDKIRPWISAGVLSLWEEDPENVAANKLSS